ncbi:MAG TPA: N-acetylmuramoyl-L-alanine amidase [Patescibacteria group bacterium]|nr:N-acetylmuramoyl-L-alanine amidase [Patescibacteria group bacterium]
MLKTVRKGFRFAILLALAATGAVLARAKIQTQGSGPLREYERIPVSLRQSPALPSPPQQSPAPPTGPMLDTVVLDPAHGGTDEGAHGSGGIVEKDVVLTLARVVQSRLERDGVTVVMTRQGDQTLSFEQRAAIANARPDAIFITLHVGSSGPVGSANVYYYDFSQVIENLPETPAAGLVYWDRAQQRSEGFSRRLAQLLQVELSERLRGSPELPSAVPVYQLREIAEPAVAIEIENVNAPSAAALDALGRPLSEAISRAIQSFRIVYPTGAR